MINASSQKDCFQMQFSLFTINPERGLSASEFLAKKNDPSFPVCLSFPKVHFLPLSWAQWQEVSECPVNKSQKWGCQNLPWWLCAGEGEHPVPTSSVGERCGGEGPKSLLKLENCLCHVCYHCQLLIIWVSAFYPGVFQMFMGRGDTQVGLHLHFPGAERKPWADPHEREEIVGRVFPT